MKQVLFFVLLAATSLFLSCSNSTKNKEESTLPEELVDRIVLVDLEGENVDITAYRGKVIFLNFWATWCRPCLAEMPDMDIAAKMLADDDIVFLAASDEKIDKIIDFVADVDYSFKFVHSKTSVFDMEIMALPTTMIINKEGKIIYNEVGARPWNSDTEIEKLKKMITE